MAGALDELLRENMGSRGSCLLASRSESSGGEWPPGRLRVTSRYDLSGLRGRLVWLSGYRSALPLGRFHGRSVVSWWSVLGFLSSLFSKVITSFWRAQSKDSGLSQLVWRDQPESCRAFAVLDVAYPSDFPMLNKLLSDTEYNDTRLVARYSADLYQYRCIYQYDQSTTRTVATWHKTTWSNTCSAWPLM